MTNLFTKENILNLLSKIDSRYDLVFNDNSLSIIYLKNEVVINLNDIINITFSPLSKTPNIHTKNNLIKIFSEEIYIENI